MHSYSALYYPFIHFKDDRWLKLSALYWDSISRIVPLNYQTEDSVTVREFGTFVQTVRPDWVRPEFGTTFVEFIAEYGGRLHARYGLHLRDGWPPVPASQRPPVAGGLSGTDPRLGYVFFEKLSPQLTATLQQSGLAAPDPSDPRWVGMHPQLARVYMTALADQIAGERGLHPLTDDAADHLAVGGWSIARLAHLLLEEVIPGGDSGHEVESVAAFVALEMALPRDVDKIPAGKILEFRAKHLADRGAFQTYLSGFLEKRSWLEKIDDPRAFEARLKEEYEKELQPRLAELRGKLSGANIDTISSVLAIQVGAPWLIAQAATLAGVAANPILAFAAGAALSFAKVARDRRKSRGEALKSSPVSYLLRAEEDLHPQGVLDRIMQKARRAFG